MGCRIADLQNKQVINIKNGCCLGFVSDVEVDTVTARLLAIVVYGRPRFLGLFGRRDDIVIPWCDIEVLGEDTVLVCVDKKGYDREKHKKNLMKALFNDE